MQQNGSKVPLQGTSAATGSSQNINNSGKSRTSLVRIQTQKLRIKEERDNLEKFRRESIYCDSKTDCQFEPKFGEVLQDSTNKSLKRAAAHTSKEKIFSNSDFVVSDCWKSTSGEIPVKLIQLFRDNGLEEEDLDEPIRKRRLLPEDGSEMLSQTKEFHVLTEVQKARIITAVEDTIKKLANKDVKDYSQAFLERQPEKLSSTAVGGISNDKFFCKKFLLPWVIMKVVEMVLCHIIQLTFLSDESYFQRKTEFLPIVVTYYLTLFIVVVSLVLHISCFSYAGIRNPCYFMGAISSSILTLTTTLGILVMLSSMEYYKSFREILVLVFIATLLCSLFAELCLCYIEFRKVARIFNDMAFKTRIYITAVCLVLLSTLFFEEVESRRVILTGRKVITRTYYKKPVIPPWATVTIVGIFMLVLGGGIYFLLNKIILGDLVRGPKFAQVAKSEAEV